MPPNPTAYQLGQMEYKPQPIDYRLLQMVTQDYPTFNQATREQQTIDAADLNSQINQYRLDDEVRQRQASARVSQALEDNPQMDSRELIDLASREYLRSGDKSAVGLLSQSRQYDRAQQQAQKESRNADRQEFKTAIETAKVMGPEAGSEYLRSLGLSDKYPGISFDTIMRQQSYDQEGNLIETRPDGSQRVVVRARPPSKERFKDVTLPDGSAGQMDVDSGAVKPYPAGVKPYSKPDALADFLSPGESDRVPSNANDGKGAVDRWGEFLQSVADGRGGTKSEPAPTTTRESPAPKPALDTGSDAMKETGGVKIPKVTYGEIRKIAGIDYRKATIGDRVKWVRVN